MEPNFLSTARTLLAIPGFLQPLVAFVASIAVSNVVSAFVKDTLVSSGMTSQTTINLAGAGFQAAIVLGGILLGGYVDRSKRYKEVTLGCFVMALLLLQPLGLTECPSSLVLISLLGLGALVGPVQPINAELAYAAPDSDISSERPSTVRLHRLSMFTPVLSYFSPLCLQAPDREPLSLSCRVEVAYPADENSIEALQQLCGNLFSALLVPIAESAATSHTPLPGGNSVSGDSVLLSGILLCALVYYSTFTSALKRSALDCVGDEDQVSISDC